MGVARDTGWVWLEIQGGCGGLGTDVGCSAGLQQGVMHSSPAMNAYIYLWGQKHAKYKHVIPCR